MSAATTKRLKPGHGRMHAPGADKYMLDIITRVEAGETLEFCVGTNELGETEVRVSKENLDIEQCQAELACACINTPNHGPVFFWKTDDHRCREMTCPRFKQPLAQRYTITYIVIPYEWILKEDSKQSD